MIPVIIDRRCEQFYTDTLEPYGYLYASTVDGRWRRHAIEKPEQSSSIALSQFRPSDPMFNLAAGLLTDLEETIVTKNYVLADVILKTAYVSVAAMAIVFVSMLLLTTLHP